VLIAGAGTAASALACLLRDSGFGVILLSPADRAQPVVIEALPEATVHLLAEAGLTPALREAHAVAVEGFENAVSGHPHHHAGRWVHVDRTLLAARCLAVARRRGATLLRYSGHLTPPREVSNGVEVTVNGSRLRGFAAVDATGRAASWSRPVLRDNPLHATLWRGPPHPSARPGRLVRSGTRWAYRLDHPSASTLGILDTSVGDRRRDRGGPTADLARRLDIDHVDRFSYVASRSAAVQWSAEPVGPRSLAVGDAALAYSPLAGQGLRLAISSAFAASAVLRTWLEGDYELANSYYRSFLTGARQRHLAALSTIASEAPASAAAQTAAHDPAMDEGDENRLCFTGHITEVGVNIGGRVVRQPCLGLPDGGIARWIGGADALDLRSAVTRGTTTSEAVRALVQKGHSPRSALLLLRWARKAGVVSTTSPPLPTPGNRDHLDAP
jgi:2-polyprenyl-6-methoxyphenol hydroxylase-like FAD-dependent oxidoreductase